MVGAIGYRVAGTAACVAVLAYGSIAATAEVAAPPPPLAVEASAGPVTAFDVKRVEAPVTLSVTIAGINPIVAWTIDVANVIVTDIGIVQQISSTDRPEVTLVAGVNHVVIGTNRSATLEDAGDHRVTVSVTDAAGATATTTTTVKVISRATLTVDGISGRPGASSRSVVWGTGSPEMRGRAVEVFFKPAGGGKAKSIGTTRVARINDYWTLRASGLGPGTIKVKAKSSYIAGTWDTLRVTRKSFRAAPPDFTEPRLFG
jgi:hypothetical protein